MEQSKNNKKIIIFLIIGAVLLFCSIFAANSVNNHKTETLKIDSVVINIGVANTDAEREQGLSGRQSIGDNEGLLFTFDTEGYYYFWMKDMNFPIDIVWFNKNKQVIHIENSVSPQTYPKSFVSETPALYVLETKSNFFESHKIKIGDTAEF